MKCEIEGENKFEWQTKSNWYKKREEVNEPSRHAQLVNISRSASTEITPLCACMW